MIDAKKQDRLSFLLGAIVFLLGALCWFYAIKVIPADQAQGDVYRILYFHVPSAITAFMSAGVLAVLSLWTLFKRSPNAALWAKSSAEIGLIYTVITLATGSIWGKPTWGVWWDWDARMTTTLLLALLYAGYIIFTNSMAAGPQRDRMAAALGIIIGLDVPIIYQSVTWWRTLHQPPSLLRSGGSTMDHDMKTLLMLSLLSMMLIGAWLIWVRAINFKLQAAIEEHSHSAHTH